MLCVAMALVYRSFCSLLGSHLHGLCMLGLDMCYLTIRLALWYVDFSLSLYICIKIVSRIAILPGSCTSGFYKVRFLLIVPSFVPFSSSSFLG